MASAHHDQEAERDAPTRERAREFARKGVGGPAGPLPHLEAIQRSFGRYDVSHVAAHIDGSAAEASETLLASAYATGNHVAFARQPDLRSAAHEAAHVVQQRARLNLPNGLGEPGDTYEQHADAVADLVVQGKSAEGLLGRWNAPATTLTSVRGQGASGTVQRQVSDSKTTGDAKGDAQEAFKTKIKAFGGYDDSSDEKKNTAYSVALTSIAKSYGFYDLWPGAQFKIKLREWAGAYTFKHTPPRIELGEENVARALNLGKYEKAQVNDADFRVLVVGLAHEYLHGFQWISLDLCKDAQKPLREFLANYYSSFSGGPEAFGDVLSALKKEPQLASEKYQQKIATIESKIAGIILPVAPLKERWIWIQEAHEQYENLKLGPNPISMSSPAIEQLTVIYDALKKYESGEPWNVCYFGSTETDFKDETLLTQLSMVLDQFPELAVEIQGYASDTGGKDELLAQARADGVREWLEQKGIDAGRLTVKDGKVRGVPKEDKQENRVVTVMFTETQLKK
jgi:outer membrane protein OmpA-like peptidoglycan-associated protein